MIECGRMENCYLEKQNEKLQYIVKWREEEKRWEKKRLARRTNRLTERGSNENGDDNPKGEMNWSFTRENSVTQRAIERGWQAMRCPSGDSKNGNLPLFSWLCYSSILKDCNWDVWLQRSPSHEDAALDAWNFSFSTVFWVNIKGIF